MEKKKRWEKPKLLVLVRAIPSEAILTHCKTGEEVGRPGGATFVYGCKKGAPPECPEICSLLTGAS